jgi:hypothetical protein
VTSPADWAASGDLCPVCSGPTRHTPDLLDEFAAAVIETADLRRRIGERDKEPTDAAERSALIEVAEEQEALIDQLEARREELLRRLGSHAHPTGADRESDRLRGLQLRVLLSGQPAG